jgi:hypothetical protein
MPRPGKEPLKRLKRVKGPVYRHCSLQTRKYGLCRSVKVGAHYRAHGSPFVPLAEAAANFLGSKPVIEGRGAIVRFGRGCSRGCVWPPSVVPGVVTLGLAGALGPAVPCWRAARQLVFSTDAESKHVRNPSLLFLQCDTSILLSILPTTSYKS